MKKILPLCYSALLLLLIHTATGKELVQTLETNPSWDTSRPDSHAPALLMGDHTHKAGEWMLSYRAIYMEMKDNQDGTDDLNTQEVFAKGFMISPTEMTMEMHMLGLMYAPTDKLTLSLMAPYKILSMDHVTRMGKTFETNTEGIGDLKLSALILLQQSSKQQLHINTGVSFPTGAIDEKDDTPAGPNQKLPYPMQLGAGTFNLLPGITYLRQYPTWSLGAQAMGSIPIDENDEGYSHGNSAIVNAWVAKKISDTTSLSLRIQGQKWENIEGQDKDLNPRMVPTADTSLRGGERIDAFLGFNLYGKKSFLKGHRLAFEIGAPLYQSLNGPQLKTEMTMGLSWQFSW